MYGESLIAKIRALGFQVEKEIPVNKTRTNYIVNKISDENPFVLKMITVYSEDEKLQLEYKFKTYKDISKKYPNHMVQLFEFYTIPGESDYEEKVLITTPYYLSLKELKQQKNLLLEDVIKIGIQIGTALTYLYNEGISCNGVTEECIYFDEKNNCYKLDNQFIKPSKEELFYYMSPEWFSSYEYTEQNDIYNIGIILYRLLNDGYFPFEGEYETEEQAQKARMEEKFPDLKFGTYNLNRVIQKACAKKEDRFQKMEELLRSFEYLHHNLKEEWLSSPLNCYYKDEKNNNWENQDDSEKKEIEKETVSNLVSRKTKAKPKKKKRKKPKITKKKEEKKQSLNYKWAIVSTLIILVSIGAAIFSGIFLFQSKNHKIQSYIDSKSYSAAEKLIREEYESGNNVDTVTKNFIELCVSQTEENKIIEVIDCFYPNYYEKNDMFFDALIEELYKRGKTKILKEIKIKLKEKETTKNLIDKIEQFIGKDEQ